MSIAGLALGNRDCVAAGGRGDGHLDHLDHFQEDDPVKRAGAAVGVPLPTEPLKALLRLVLCCNRGSSGRSQPLLLSSEFSAASPRITRVYEGFTNF